MRFLIQILTQILVPQVVHAFHPMTVIGPGLPGMFGVWRLFGPRPITVCVGSGTCISKYLSEEWLMLHAFLGPSCASSFAAPKPARQHVQ